MSAICGVYARRNPEHVPVFLSSMMSKLAHRGIDGHSEWSKKNIGLGIQQLFITPESHHNPLPYYDSNQKLAIVADMRLDNRPSLLKQLHIADKDISDSQLCLLGYRTWGVTLAEHLKGEFALCLFDESAQELIFITDPCGIRTIYYHISSDYIVFSSEIKALLALPIVPQRPNLSQIAKIDFFLEKSNPAETYFENIYALPAATTWTITQTHTGQQRRYWQPNAHLRIHLKDETEYVEYFQSIFEHAIQHRIKSTYPVASTLSGGLDSSAVTAMAARLLDKENRKLRTYSVKKSPELFDSALDETEFVSHFDYFSNLERSFVSDSWRGPFDFLDELAKASESPDFTSRHYHLSAFASEMKMNNERILLTGRYGEGGPSSSGAGYYAELFLKGKIGTLIDEIRHLSQYQRVNTLQFIKSQLIKPLLPAQFFRPRLDLLRKQATSYINPAFQTKHLGETLSKLRKQSFQFGHIKANHRQNQLQTINWFLKEQKSRFRFLGYEHIELSYPFLDQALVEFCLAIPGEMKIHRGLPRYMIRKGMQNIMPEPICQRRTKRPFSPDYHFRYNRQRQQALAYIQEIEHQPLVQEIININQLKQNLLRLEMQQNQILSDDDFTMMIAIPNTVFLIAFIKQFFID